MLLQSCFFFYSPYKPPATAEQTTSRPVARDPENIANRMQTLDIAPSTNNRDSGHSGDHSLPPNSADSVKSSSSTGSGGSGDPLIKSSPSAPVGSPHLVYAQLNVKHTQIQPPANDDPVQYAQIEHQD